MSYTNEQILRTVKHVRTVLVNYNSSQGCVLNEEIINPIIHRLFEKLTVLTNKHPNARFFAISSLNTTHFSDFLSDLKIHGIHLPKNDAFYLFKSGTSIHRNGPTRTTICRPKVPNGTDRVKSLSEEMKNILEENYCRYSSIAEQSKSKGSERQLLVFSFKDCLKPGTSVSTPEIDSLLSNFQFNLKL